MAVLNVCHCDHMYSAQISVTSSDEGVDNGRFFSGGFSIVTGLDFFPARLKAAYSAWFLTQMQQLGQYL